MRTPNCKCVVCEKPLYRRPSELERVRHVACMEHRALAQSLSGVTDAQKRGLALGRKKGTNHRLGYHHKEESKLKISARNKLFWAKNPEKLAERSEKIRNENHYRWAGGASRLNTSIRQMQENRKWMDAVKLRDKVCVRCGSTDDLEAHHEPALATLIEELGITGRDDARRCAAALWDKNKGITLCARCHDAEHGRSFRPRSQRKTNFCICKQCGHEFAAVPSRKNARFCSMECSATWRSLNLRGTSSSTWKGGLVQLKCKHCGGDMWRKPVNVEKSKYCNRICHHAARRGKSIREYASSSAGAFPENSESRAL